MTAKTTLRFLNLGHFFDHFFLLIFPIAVIAIERDWNLDYGAALALGTPIYAAFAIGTLPAGWLGDHWRREWLIALLFFGCGISSVMAALSSGPVLLMISLGGIGLFASIYHPVGLSMVTQMSKRPGRALAVNGIYGNLGLAGATLLTGLLAETYGWRSAFLLPGLAAIVVGILYLALNRRAATATEQHAGNVTASAVAASRATQLRVFAVILLAALFGGAVFNGVSISLPKLFEERLIDVTSDLSAIGSYTALVFAAAAFAQLPVGDLLDRFGAKPVLAALLVLQVGALILVANTSGLLVVPAALILVLLMFAEVPITGWLMGRYVPLSWRSRAFAVEYVLSLGMSSAIVPLIAGLHSMGYGFDRQYLLLAASAGIVLLAAAALPSRHQTLQDTASTA
ncbi:MFS transporter [Pelagibius sp. Alg239-R121]|uniref:MFS transporter n=1 Tax=Pelagibius sp. Alg239-R121 TaxID=2993448 RepID=UPI0024A63A3D|nr:MFS transporter [Pelagibius sp. Alg239-R121]